MGNIRTLVNIKERSGRLSSTRLASPLRSDSLFDGCCTMEIEELFMISSNGLKVDFEGARAGDGIGGASRSRMSGSILGTEEQNNTRNELRIEACKSK